MYVGNNHESTCFWGSNVDTHLCWKINGGSKCASSIDSRHTCLRSKVATHVHVCIGDQQQKYIGNKWWL